MPDRARLEARIASLDQLRELFSAMQAMSAARVQAAHGALQGIRRYAEVVEKAIGDASSLQRLSGPVAPEEPTTFGALVVIGAEHGFTGAFNRLLLERARSARAPGESVGIVGRRIATVAEEHRLEPAWILPMATQVDGVLSGARSVAARLGDVGSVRAVFARYRGGDRLEIEVRRVLPPDRRLLAPRNGHVGPLHHLALDVLLRQLFGELLLAELTLAMMESFASESAARLQIMQAADHNIGDKLDHLRRQARDSRQEDITAELLEIVAGGDAVLKRSTRR